MCPRFITASVSANDLNTSNVFPLRAQRTQGVSIVGGTNIIVWLLHESVPQPAGK